MWREITATPGRRDFPGDTRKETRVGTGSRTNRFRDTLQAAAVSVDDEKIAEPEVSQPKESISDVRLEVELIRKQ